MLSWWKTNCVVKYSSKCWLQSCTNRSLSAIFASSRKLESRCIVGHYKWRPPWSVASSWNLTFNKIKAFIGRTIMVIQCQKLNTIRQGKDYDLRSVTVELSSLLCFRLFYICTTWHSQKRPWPHRSWRTIIRKSCVNFLQIYKTL